MNHGEHHLKTDPEPFVAVWEGKKTFEVRINDRGFQVGDLLRLRETAYSSAEIQEGAPIVYTGREIGAVVTWITSGGKYGVDEGFVVMSIQVITRGAEGKSE